MRLFSRSVKPKLLRRHRPMYLSQGHCFNQQGSVTLDSSLGKPLGTYLLFEVQIGGFGAGWEV